MRKPDFLILCLAFAPAAWGAVPPFITGHTDGGGARNAASYMPPSLAGGAIAQGSLFSLFGTGLGPATGVSVSAFPIKSTFNGVSVSIAQGTTSVAALPVYVSASQLNLIMPSDAPLGRVIIQVTYNGQTSNLAPATVAASSFGIFTVAGGVGPGIFTDYLGASVPQAVNSLTQTAAPNQLVTIWGTGLGPVKADNVAPTAGDLPAETEVFVGGIPATIQYHGRSPCCSGLDQIVFTVPANAPQGCYVPVSVRTAGTIVSNVATMAIAPKAGGACSDNFNALEKPILAGQPTGVVSLDQVNTTVDVIVLEGGGETTTDYASAAMFKPTAGQFFFHPLISLPPQGTCTVFTADYDLLGTLYFPAEVADGQLLSAGSPLTLSGGGNVASSGSAPILYNQLLGGTSTASYITFSSGPFFNPPAAVTVSAPGGADVQKFSVSIPTSGTLEWSDQASLETVTRSKPLTVNWSASGLTNATVLIAGDNFDTPNDASSMFLCTAAASAGTFTVPAWAMSNVPATSSTATTPTGFVVLGLVPLGAPTTFTATGLEAGFGFYASWIAQSVIWQ
jgi:uncharacterized protein (TIGR03437 family)